MGAGMVRSLAGAGMEVTVWNRTAEKARALTGAGVRAVEDVTAAVAGADVIVTMLFDADTVTEVMRRALPAAGPDTVWVQSTTVGLAATTRLARLAEEHGTAFFDTPVLGSRQVAENGALVVVAAGPQGERAVVEPVYDAIGSRTIWAGEQAGDAQRLKMVFQSWVLSVTAATGQAVGLAEGLGVAPLMFLEAIAGGPLNCGYAQAKGRVMMAGDFSPDFTVDGAVKDGALVVEAMGVAGSNDGLMQAVRQEFESAAGSGHRADDMAAVVHAFRH
ncbi:3-hydroxyisobutyrate dehydrogenase [Nocardiopsis ansamitocini]|uniref:3-hydroxyisobutyrate dehydrogenase n=2 Tax=Nocardiopsis ansamitocini TaxID=1670832 RepID=A0A9W6UL10_9ACTN|nr:3-hydroxyisobutyrate dehydrogenase [Nocardiopsis ansamitocini]